MLSVFSCSETFGDSTFSLALLVNAYGTFKSCTAVSASLGSLFSWDYRPRLFFETGLSSPHRLTSSINLSDSRRFRMAVGDELMTTLERNSPTFVADEKKDSVSAELRPFYARFRALVDSEYELVAAEGDLRLYQRRSPWPSTGRPD